MMRNLVLGSEGFIGKAFSQFLEAKGEEVVRFDIKRTESEDARTADLGLDEVDRVYILAWDVGGAKYLYHPDQQLHQLRWNMALMQNVFSQLEKTPKPFLFISSQLADEVDSVYGATKRLGEVWTKVLGGAFIRQWNVYGPMEEISIRSHVISDFVHQAITTGKIEMMTTGEERRQFIHVDDVCTAWYHALSDNVDGVHDVTSFEWVTIRRVADMIAERTGAKVIPGSRQGNTPNTPMRGKLPGWSPKMSLAAGLDDMIARVKAGKYE